MKKYLVILFLSFTLTGLSQRITPYQGSRIFWDMSTQLTIFPSGGYSRMIQLQDGRLLAVAESGGVSVSYSSNLGKTWSTPQCILASPDKIGYCVPDVAQLKDGTIIIGYNPRPSAPYSNDRRFSICSLRSTDNGNSWSVPTIIFDGSCVYTDGSWEPSFLELPSGELQCYFANEFEYTQSEEQNISMCRSYDNGQTWTEPETVCYRPGSRDGMPVPVLLKDNSEIVFIIEDNGWPGRASFAATTIRTTLEDNWSSGIVGADSEKRNMIFQDIPANDLISAAPYLRVLPNGETVASYQGNENRTNDNLDMSVLIGDERAKNFKARSNPFSLPVGEHSLWNSVAVIDTGVVVALGSIDSHVEMIKGYPKRQANANYGSVTVDGIYGTSEVWTGKSRAQLFMGNKTKNKTTIDFLYDDTYLYFTARVIDRTLVSDKSSNDGITLSIDADDVSTANPQAGVYSIYFDAGGNIMMKAGNNGSWDIVKDVTAINYAVDVKSLYYTIEAAIPWSILGKDKAPVGQRMAINLSLKDVNADGIAYEGIVDALDNAPWTWLEFRLNGASGVSNAEVDNDDIVTYVEGNTLNIKSKVNVTNAFLYSIEGKLILSSTKCGNNFQLPLNERNGNILKVVLEDGRYISKKIL